MKERKTGILPVLKNRNFTFLWIGQAVSHFGNTCFSIGNVWLVMELTGSTVAMGSVLALGFIPNVIFSLIGGGFADRYNRKKIMIISDITRGIAVLTIPILLILGREEVYPIYLVTFFIAIMANFFNPAFTSTIPTIVEKQNLLHANSLFVTTMQGLGIAGPGIAGILIAAVGLKSVYIIDSISFMVGAVMTSMVVFPLRKKRVREGKGAFVKEIGEGVLFIKNHAFFLFIVLLAFFINFLLGPINVILPLFSDKILHLGAKGFGFMGSALAVGTFLGSLMTATIGAKIKEGYRLVSGLIGCGLFLALFGCFPSLAPVLIFLALMGFSVMLANISLSTIFQRETPNEILGRASGAMNAASMAAMPLSAFLTGFLLEMVPVQPFIMVIGTILVVVNLAVGIKVIKLMPSSVLKKPISSD